MGRSDPFVPYARYVTREVEVVAEDTLPGVPVVAYRSPVEVGDGHRRRAAGVRWNHSAAAVYERDGLSYVVTVGDLVGPSDDQETVVAIGRESLVVEDGDRVRRTVALDRRARAGWRGMIEDRGIRDE
jgi:hypothetical protein